MPKKKKRLQMQKITEEKLVRRALDHSVELGLMDQVGYDANGEPLYMMPLNAEARVEILRKIMDSRENANN